MSGILYGLGVGPGDPDLITLKALRIIQKAPVIAYPAPDIGKSLARAIAGPHIPANKTEIPILTPMVPDKFPAHDVYDKYAAKIAGHLSAGCDVAVLCEGDPFLYGSFMYLFARLSNTYPTQVVPGVSSLGACAAAAGMPLVSRNEILSVVPGPLEENEIEGRLKQSSAVAIMKVGRHLDKIRSVVNRLGLQKYAHYVEYASMSDQRAVPLSQIEAHNAPYFSMILIRQPSGEDGK
ncbi:MAG: precorrin-2 C(20)-methyltransferase [Rhodospirillaceae bacterium TMED8]|nr:precorrin-2 C(20)-methyltransferase [Magnetovibrio sp.]OUT47792.1 MAG: precorrin-2 C(20)-methyltransferase [Rhodospirillaceae bacterium TMED8]